MFFINSNYTLLKLFYIFLIIFIIIINIQFDEEFYLGIINYIFILIILNLLLTLSKKTLYNSAINVFLKKKSFFVLKLEKKNNKILKKTKSIEKNNNILLYYNNNIINFYKKDYKNEYNKKYLKIYNKIKENYGLLEKTLLKDIIFYNFKKMTSFLTLQLPLSMSFQQKINYSNILMGGIRIFFLLKKNDIYLFFKNIQLLNLDKIERKKIEEENKKRKKCHN